jgi:hypothetical protein
VEKVTKQPVAWPTPLYEWRSGAKDNPSSRRPRPRNHTWIGARKPISVSSPIIQPVRTIPANTAARSWGASDAEYCAGSRQVTAADCEKQNQPGKEVAVKGCALQPYVGKRHSISHDSDAAGAKPIEKQKRKQNTDTVSGSALFGWLAPFVSLWSQHADYSVRPHSAVDVRPCIISHSF